MQDPELRQQFDSVPMLSDDLNAMHEACAFIHYFRMCVHSFVLKTLSIECRYTTAVSKLTLAMSDVRHVLKPAALENKSPSVKMWNHEEEGDFVLRPRKEASQNDARRGSSWSWFVA